MSLPTEDEIRAVAAELGLVDEHGNYPREKRTQLAAVAVAMRDVPDDGDEPETLTTAQALSRFHDEMAAEGFALSAIADIIRAAATALITRDGLIIKENRTP